MNSLSAYYQPLELIAWQSRFKSATLDAPLNIIVENCDQSSQSLLSAMLHAIGYSLPTVQQVNSSQIKTLSAGILLIFGEKAAQTVLDSTQTLDALRGQIHTLAKNNLSVIVTYHPLDLLQNPLDKKKAYSDLKLTLKALATSL